MKIVIVAKKYHEFYRYIYEYVPKKSEQFYKDDEDHIYNILMAYYIMVGIS